ncbi:hypothetical protein D9Q98_001379 [Chlorella vulgaris]|uniref:Iron hydrogenase small subunit domain-containing protein n=1 Tax=Chlorella vulgaris TaxID=3077 RepID=A0A9D4U004_CHLVU|nr:hypothetical protein D9Q98_001379 [Chlorella vulgaris]
MFSGAVKIGDLHDFISPAQACVVNLEGGKLPNNVLADAEAGTVQLQPRKPQGFAQTLPAAADEAIKVSLHDCLACSGCVTSAEAVLLQHQSAGELLQRLADPDWTVVVSLSPQSIAALAAVHRLSSAECAARLTAFLRHLGVAAVFDIAAARQVALAEAAREFLQRYRSSRGGSTAEAAAAAGQDAAGGGDDMDVDRPKPSSDGHRNAVGGGSPGPLPMLASACPGWVCYAEKTHGDHVLPYIATGKSPQAVLGTLVKRQWCAAAGLAPDRVYHCSVMPCYDKKLEGARDDFWLPGTSVPETDCVLATTELQELLEQRQADLHSLQGIPFDAILPAAAAAAAAPSGTRASSSGGSSAQHDTVQLPTSSSSGSGSGVTATASSGSGGYLEHVFRSAARELFGLELPPGPLPVKVGRNADLRELSLEAPDGTVLRFAAAYGFRNIQGLMRKVKLGRCEYDYVEVMACPSGCLNGGGQPKPTAKQTPAQLLEQLEELYAAGGIAARPEADPALQQLYMSFVQGEPGSQAAHQLMHTHYHKRDKTVTATLADW